MEYLGWAKSNVIEDGGNVSTGRKGEKSTERLDHNRVDFVEHSRGRRPEGKGIGNNRFGDCRDEFHNSFKGS
jgi:hypothetical protein